MIEVETLTAQERMCGQSLFLIPENGGTWRIPVLPDGDLQDFCARKSCEEPEEASREILGGQSQAWRHMGMETQGYALER